MELPNSTGTFAPWQRQSEGLSRPGNTGSVDRRVKACGDVSFTKKQSIPQKLDLGPLIPVVSDTIPGQSRYSGCDRVPATSTTMYKDTEAACYTNICLQNNSSPTAVPSGDATLDLCRGAPP